jgi:hypothetical protein
MKKMQNLISAGFAAAALVSASVPALAWTVWPDVDFEWYANVGKPVNGTVVEVMPPPRAGYIWAPGHWETRSDNSQAFVGGQWVADDYTTQIATYASPVTISTSSEPIRDRDGVIIPMSPSAYPVDSAGKQ